MANTLILCDCSKSQILDSKTISKATGMGCSRVHTALCTDELADAAALMQTGNTTIACLQERQVFEELAEELGVETPDFVDIRDRAGWSDEGADSMAKMAALLADSQLMPKPQKMVDIYSDGRCLIIGSEAIVLQTAAQLSDQLSVTVLLDTAPDIPIGRSFDVVLGKLRSARGSLGGFDIRIDALQIMQPAGRGEFGFTKPRDGGQTTCDILLDLRGEPALFPTGHKRDGYLRADPKHPASVASAVLDASQLIGDFDKPFYVALDANICAHSRAGITGCSRCIDSCETGAISPDGDHVKIDPLICAGCGGCAAGCPSGAITFAAPSTDFLMQRIETMSRIFRSAGGIAPRLLVHDAEFGSELISLSARFDRGLPADVIPLEVESLTSFGHAEMLAALGCGFVAVDLLLGPNSEKAPIETAHTLAMAISDNAAIRLLDITDPEALSTALYGQKSSKPCDPILPIGNRRQITRLAAKALRGQPDAPIPLPEGAPFGAVIINTDACTLCLSCVSLCPSGALLDNQDSPQLRFQQDACLQCGICSNACPENAITLQPQLDLSDTALSQTVLHEEDPFACISCGSLFGTKSSIDNIVEKLAGKHPMFATSEAGKLIQMCDKCRIEAQFYSDSNPFQGGVRPKTRTTDDYLKRRDH
ncbi:MAG: 4Fe-4S binding protein [Rhodobacteraceae bacterium]|nr:4Fe-4S binding protein [Paracoccaceae bacterium]